MTKPEVGDSVYFTSIFDGDKHGIRNDLVRMKYGEIEAINFNHILVKMVDGKSWFIPKFEFDGKLKKEYHGK